MDNVMKYYFASTKNFDGQVVQPHIPKNRMGKEDSTTNRICVSQSINGCLTAIGGFDFEDIVYIHECEVHDAVQPTINQVPDRCYTGENWVTSPIEMHLFKTLKIIGMIDSRVGAFNNTLYCFTVLE